MCMRTTEREYDLELIGPFFYKYQSLYALTQSRLAKEFKWIQLNLVGYTLLSVLVI